MTADHLPMVVRALAVLVGIAGIVYCWHLAVQMTPRTAHAVERWAVSVLAVASLVLVLSGVVMGSLLLPGLAIGAGAGTVLGLAKATIAHQVQPARRTRAPQEWRDG